MNRRTTGPPCSKCGEPLEEGTFLCYSEVCGYRSPPTGPVSAGRYRHPVNADGMPCSCNQGHVSKNLAG